MPRLVDPHAPPPSFDLSIFRLLGPSRILILGCNVETSRPVAVGETDEGPRYSILFDGALYRHQIVATPREVQLAAFTRGASPRQLSGGHPQNDRQLRQALQAVLADYAARTEQKPRP